MSSKEPAGHLADDEHLSVLGYEGKFDRSMSLWANFALGFTYLSPLVGVYSLLAVALATGGPPSIWWIVIVAILAFISCVLSLQAAVKVAVRHPGIELLRHHGSGGANFQPLGFLFGLGRDELAH